MTKAIILPTRELVVELTTYDSFFYFISGGVKGLIAEIVFEAGGARDSFSHFAKRPVCDFAVISYESRIDDFDFDQAEYLSTVGQIEFLVSNIEKEVNALLKSVTLSDTLILSDRRHMWIGDDLMVVGDVRRRHWR